MKNIGVIDYGMGNLFSVQRSLSLMDVNAVITNNAEEFERFDGLVLPGVGAFKEAMNALADLNAIGPIQNLIEQGKPFLGICLGMQLLLESSQEFGHTEGLGIIKGTVKKITPKDDNCKMLVPHVGWEETFFIKKDHPALLGLNSGEDMYYVHSYYVELNDPEDELTWTKYHDFKFTSAFEKKNVWAFQFHPEKSAHSGLKILKNWVTTI